MKIAYLSTFYPFRGGIAQYNAALYRAFEQEHTIRAFTFKRQYPDLLFPGSSQYVTADDDADIVDSQAILDTVNPLSYISSARTINQFAPDLMLTKFWMPFFAPSLGTVAKFSSKKIKKIAILDNVIPHERRIGDIALTKYFLNQQDGFVVMSEAVKQDLLSLAPHASYVYHAHPFFDHFGKKIDKTEAQQKLQIPSGKKVILFFGFIREYKGLDILIKAMQDAPKDYLLLIAGETYGSFKPYEDLIAETGIGQQVQQEVRYINDHEVPLFFSASDVCVLPYRSATQSGITSIAYHFNVPVIATDVGGLAEVVKHNENGLLVPEPDPALIHQSLKYYFDNQLQQQFESNIERLKQELSWQHLAETITDFYHQL